MIIEYEGTAYHFDVQKISIDEWRELKRKYRMSANAFDEGMSDGDPDAYTFLYWILLRQNGRDRGLPLGDHLKPDLLALNNATMLAQKAEAEAEAAREPEAPEPGPTVSASPSPAASASPPALPTLPPPNQDGTEVMSSPGTAS